MAGFLENIVANALQNALGAYFVGVEKQRLKVDVFSGQVVLPNLPVRKDALATWQLPYRVRWGVVGTLRIKVPWQKLGKEPVDKATLETPLNDQLHRVNLDGTDRRRITSVDLNHGRFIISPDGRTVAAMRQAVDVPVDRRLQPVRGRRREGRLLEGEQLQILDGHLGVAHRRRHLVPAQPDGEPARSPRAG